MEDIRYTLIKQEELKDLQGVGYFYEHNVTKAQVCFIVTADENKTFSVAFRTPPQDSTGVAHILEHSVLCGSQKYPVKDPFIELAKGSLNTFLNAMTYSDKTMYPVASVNDKDFHNLMDVYLDAVFFPNIYTEKKTFEQEGWHYDLEDIEGDVTYKGVVYNEMKGAFSSPEQTLMRTIQAELFAGHVYGVESGGDPMDIPNLTYENFLDFHRNYYHPSNSYFFFYGNVNVQEELQRLDATILSHFEYRSVESKIEKMPRFTQPKNVVKEYPIAEDEPENKRSYLTYNILLHQSDEIIERMAMDILDYVLMDAPGAPMKEAVLNAGIGEDVFSHYDDSKQESNFSIIAKNCNENQQKAFIQVVEQTLQRLVEEGIPKETLRGAIQIFEFRIKEGDFGSCPAGVMYAIKTLETWLYEQDPFVHYHYETLFNTLKEKVDCGFYERLLQEYFLENAHKVYLTLKPNKQFNTQQEKVIQGELRAYEEQLSETEREELVAYTRELVEFQEAPETVENLATLPRLTLEDIPRDKKEFIYTTDMLEDTKLFFHEANCSNIAYVNGVFDVAHIEEEQLSVLSLLAIFLGNLSTSKNHYSQLSDKINQNTGGIFIKLKVFSHKDSVKYYSPVLEVSGRSFVHQVKSMYLLIDEVLQETQFDDVKRMRELLNESKSRLQMSLNSSGHTTVMRRAQSYISQYGSYSDHIQGIHFYDELCHWQNSSDETLKDLGGLMKKMLEEIVSSDGLTLALTGSQEHRDTVIQNSQEFVRMLPNYRINKEKKMIQKITPINEGIKTVANVQYVAMAGNFKQQGFEYSGALKVLNKMISLKYLWNQIRVKGGAYGAFADVQSNGMITLASYRDPNLQKTMEAYREISEFIESIDLTDEELTKYIIGTMGAYERPLTPKMCNEKMLGMYFVEVTYEDEQKNRHEILDTTVDMLKSYREMYQKVLRQPVCCALGNENKIEQESEGLESIRRLF